jgi:hypothetical protein
MSPAAATFVAQLRGDARFGNDMADQFVDAFRELDAKADRSVDVFEFQSGVEWIAEAPRSLDEKLDALVKLFALSKQHSGRVTVNMREMTGW